MALTTLEQYDLFLAKCKELVMKKHSDYGASWRILRPSSLTDQLYIKASRIRQIEEAGMQKVADPITDEYIGLINYCILAIIQLSKNDYKDLALSAEELSVAFDREARMTRDLLEAKNHDYGEIWRAMRISSYTDLILMKLLRVKRIEDNGGQTQVSEGLVANYRDIINYAVFALIKLSEKE